MMDVSCVASDAAAFVWPRQNLNDKMPYYSQT